MVDKWTKGSKVYLYRDDAVQYSSFRALPIENKTHETRPIQQTQLRTYLVFSLNDIEQLALSDRFPAACDAEFCNPARLQPLSEVLRRNQLSFK
jgi:hypothetical protein